MVFIDERMRFLRVDVLSSSTVNKCSMTRLIKVHRSVRIVVTCEELLQIGVHGVRVRLVGCNVLYGMDMK